MRKFISLQLFLLLIIAQSIIHCQSAGTIRNSITGNFEDPSIWQLYNGSSWITLGRTPTINDSLIKITSSTSVTLNSPFSADEILVENNATLTLTASASLSISNSYRLYDFDVYGTVNCSGAITVNNGAAVCFEAGTFTGTGTITISAGASFYNAVNQCTLNAVLNNYGTLNLTGFTIIGTGTINNYAAIAVNNSSSFSLFPVVNNYSAITKSGTGTCSFYGLLNNQGSINISGGRLVYDPSNNSSVNLFTGQTTINAGSYLQFGGSYNTKTNITGTISGAGELAFNGGTDTLSGTVNLTGTTGVYGGNVTLISAGTFTDIGKYTQSSGTVNLAAGVSLVHYHPDFTVSGGTLNLNSGSAFTFDNFVLSGTVNGLDSLKVLNSFTWTGGSLNNSGSITLGSSCSTVVKNNSVYNYRTIYNSGVFTWQDAYFYGTGTLINNLTLNFNTTGGYSFNNTIINNAAFNKTTNNTNSVSGGITNTGNINVNSGALSVSSAGGTYSIGGGITVLAGATIYLGGGGTGGSYTLAGTVSGAGTVNMGASSVSITGVYNVSGFTVVSGGTISFPAAATITNIGKYTQTAGTVNFLSGLLIQQYHPDFTVSGGTISMNTGSAFTFNNFTLAANLNGTDSIKVVNSFLWSGGALNNAGALTLAAQCSTVIANSSYTNNRTIYNAGILTWNGFYFYGTGIIENTGTLNIATSGGYSFANLINNIGTINKTTNTSTSLNGSLTNNGTINAIAGTLSINNSGLTHSIGGSIVVSAGATFAFGNGGSTGTYNVGGNLSGQGTISFNTTTVNITGVYNITGGTAMAGGTANFNAGASLSSFGIFTFSGGTMIFNQGVSLLNLPATVTVAAGTIKFLTGSSVSIQTLSLSGTLDGSDTVVIQTGCTLDHATINGSGALVFNPGCTTQISNTLSTFNKTVINYGSATVTNISIGGTGSLTNFGTFTCNSNSTYILPQLVNNGLFVKTGTGALTMYGETNNDTIQIIAGTYNHSSGTFTNNGTMLIQNVAVFQAGTAITNNSNIEIATAASITGSVLITNNNAIITNNGTVAAQNVFTGNSAIYGTGAFTNTLFTINSSSLLVFQNDHQLKNLTISAGGRCAVTGVTLKLNGTGTIITNNGTFISAGSVVEYNGSSAQTISVTNINYDGLSVNNSAGVTLASARTINSLHLKNGVFFCSGFLTLTQGALIYRGNGSLSGNPVFTSEVNYIYNGTTAITTGAELTSLPVQIGYLKIDDSSGVTLNKNITVRDSILFSKGNLITTNNYTVLLSEGGKLLYESAQGSLQGTFNYSETVSAGQSIMGGCGFVISAGSGNPGLVSLIRYTGAQGTVTVGSHSGIKRKYVVTSQNVLQQGRGISILWHSGDDNAKTFGTNNRAFIWQLINGKWKSVSLSTDVSVNRTIAAQNIGQLTTFTVTDSLHPLAPTFFSKFYVQGRYNDGICTPDTVYGILYNTVAPYTATDSCTAVYNSKGEAVFNFTNVQNANQYYFCLKGRNFIPTWTSSSVQFTNDNASWNFTTGADKAYGNNQQYNGFYAEVFTGDINQDGVVDLSDLLLIDNDNANFASGYLLTDLNGDDVVDLSDLLICDNNNAAFVSQVSPIP